MRASLSLLFLFASSLAGQAPQVSAPADDVAKAHHALEGDQVDEAIAILQKLAVVEPPVKGVQHELGLAYYRTGKLVEAKDAFAKAIGHDSSDQESVQMEGLALYRLGQQAAAIPYLEKVLQWMPNANTDAQHVLGLCYLNAQRYDDARAAFAAQYDVPHARRVSSQQIGHGPSDCGT